jgi:hypothetical protein
VEVAPGRNDGEIAAPIDNSTARLFKSCKLRGFLKSPLCARFPRQARMPARGSPNGLGSGRWQFLSPGVRAIWAKR